LWQLKSANLGTIGAIAAIFRRTMQRRRHRRRTSPGQRVSTSSTYL
jgi:hypothetical protein